jgi:hypothetical protein
VTSTLKSYSITFITTRRSLVVLLKTVSPVCRVTSPARAMCVEQHQCLM